MSVPQAIRAPKAVIPAGIAGIQFKDGIHAAWMPAIPAGMTSFIYAGNECNYAAFAALINPSLAIAA